MKGNPVGPLEASMYGPHFEAQSPKWLQKAQQNLQLSQLNVSVPEMPAAVVTFCHGKLWARGFEARRLLTSHLPHRHRYDGPAAFWGLQPENAASMICAASTWSCSNSFDTHNHAPKMCHALGSG